MSFKVGDNFRTNYLSTLPGGYTVEVLMNDGRLLEYDKIKNPSAYIDRMYMNPNVEWARVKK